MMQRFWKTAVAATALALTAGAAHAAATVISFDGLGDTPTLFAHGDEFGQSGFWLAPFSNQLGAHSGGDGDLVGAFVDGSRLDETCTGVACPGGNSTSFYAGLNDGVLAMGREDGQLFTLTSLDLGFIGAIGGAAFPAGSPLVMKVRGVNGSTVVNSTLALAPPVNGRYDFATFSLDADFRAGAFKEVFLYGLPCDASGSCTGFVSNKGQFALDNINAVTVTAVPEPGQWLLMGLGLMAMSGFIRRRRAA